MIVNVYQTHQDYENDLPVLRISVHEIIEFAGRKLIMDHVRECDRSEWLVEWQHERLVEFSELLQK